MSREENRLVKRAREAEESRELEEGWPNRLLFVLLRVGTALLALLLLLWFVLFVAGGVGVGPFAEEGPCTNLRGLAKIDCEEFHDQCMRVHDFVYCEGDPAPGRIRPVY